MAYEWKKGDLEWARPIIKEPSFNKIQSKQNLQEELKTAS